MGSFSRVACGLVHDGREELVKQLVQLFCSSSHRPKTIQSKETQNPTFRLYRVVALVASTLCLMLLVARWLSTV